MRGARTHENDIPELRRRHFRRELQDCGWFGLPYGGYHTVAINSAGKTVAVMEEGDSSQLHGDIWLNRQT